MRLEYFGGDSGDLADAMGNARKAPERQMTAIGAVRGPVRGINLH
jgi:hypothetical protein